VAPPCDSVANEPGLSCTIAYNRDQTCLPSSTWGPAAITISTQLGSLKFTKPNPRDFPVVGFTTTTQSSTSPNRLKYWSSDADDTKLHQTLNPLQREDKQPLWPVLCGYLPAVCISVQCAQMNNGAQENQAISHFNVPNTAQGSVLTHFRWGGIFIDNFLANLMFALTAKDFWNLVSSWQIDRRKIRLFDSRQLMAQFCYLPASQHTPCIQYHTVL